MEPRQPRVDAARRQIEHLAGEIELADRLGGHGQRHEQGADLGRRLHDHAVNRDPQWPEHADADAHSTSRLPVSLVWNASARPRQEATPIQQATRKSFLLAQPPHRAITDPGGSLASAPRPVAIAHRPPNRRKRAIATGRGAGSCVPLGAVWDAPTPPESGFRGSGVDEFEELPALALGQAGELAAAVSPTRRATT